MLISTIAEKFSLPYEFLRNAIVMRVGKSINCTMQGDELYTAAFVQMHSARVRGALRALSRPTPISDLNKLLPGVHTKLAAQEATRCVSTGELDAELTVLYCRIVQY